MMVQGQCKPNAIEFTRNSCLGKRLLRRRAAEVQPVLVFEDKVRESLGLLQLYSANRHISSANAYQQLRTRLFLGENLQISQKCLTFAT
jgi:hypothetical protein